MLIEQMNKDLKNFIFLTVMVNNTDIKNIEEYDTPLSFMELLLLNPKETRKYYKIFIREVYNNDIDKNLKSKFGKEFNKHIRAILNNFTEPDYNEYKKKFIK